MGGAFCWSFQNLGPMDLCSIMLPYRQDVIVSVIFWKNYMYIPTNAHFLTYVQDH